VRRLGWVLLLALVAHAAPNDPVIRCPRVPAAPRVDGDLGEEPWQATKPHVISGIDHVDPGYRQDWTGDQDLWAQLRTVVHGEDLYLAVEVHDDRLLHEGNRLWWCGDSIELFLETDLMDEDTDESYSDDDYQIFLMPFYPSQRWGVYRGGQLSYPDERLSGLEVAHTLTEGGYVVEAKVPLSSFALLRPDVAGCIGFDLAINDVDDPTATRQQTYLTLSGRFSLFAVPGRFARLAIGDVRPPSPAPPPDPAPLVDWLGLGLGLVAVTVVALLARWLVRRIVRRTRVRAATAAAVFVLFAALCGLLPTLLAFADARATRAEWSDAVDGAQAAAEACLDLDNGDAEERAEHLLTLFRDGEALVRPSYEYRCVAARPEARLGPGAADAPGPARFSIAVAPAESRRFPLLGADAPARLRLDLAVTSLEERMPADRPAAEARIEFRSGASLQGEAKIAPRMRILFDAAERRGERLEALVVRNRLPSRTLLVDALYGEDAGATWTTQPLATRTAAGVPFDIGHDRPASHLLAVPHGGATTIDIAGAGADRLWVALKTEGAYPATPYGVDVALLRVSYADGQPGPELRVVNGRDVASAYAGAPDPESLRWEDENRQPRVYTVHALDLDPARPLRTVEVSDLGVLPTLVVAAATLGQRVAETPPLASELRLEGNRLMLSADQRARYRPLGFSVRSPRGVTRATGPSTGVAATRDLSFGQGEKGALEILLPRTPWVDAVVRRDATFAGGAALLLAFAAVVAGATLLARARRLRVKMLAALAAATGVPLVFLVVSLMRILNVAAEDELRDFTLGALESADDRVAAGKARARDLAFTTARDLSLVPPEQAETVARHVALSRDKVEAQGGFLRLPELDPEGPSPLGSTFFFDRLAGPGLYWSPWDGLVAVGFARTPDQRRCIVGLPARELVADAPKGSTIVVFSPDGEPLASSAPLPEELRLAGARERGRARFGEATRLGRPLYEARAAFPGEPVAAAYALLREAGQPLGLLGVYRSRAATDDTKASTLRTLLLSTLAALFLVVIAGGTLVDRVTHRLQRVSRAARAIAAGDLGNRAPVEEEDEVGRLALSFNMMAHALDDRLRQLTELHRGLHELTAALDREEVARAACSLLARATGAPGVQVAVLDATGEGLEVLHRRGEGTPLPSRLPADGPLRDAVELKRSLVREGGVFLPLFAGGRVVGLATCSPIERDRDPDRAFLDASGRQIGIALENARLYHAAVTDELTGLYTTPFFVRRLKEEVDRAAAAGRPLSLLRIVIHDVRGLARRHGAAAAAKAVAVSAAAIEEVLPRRNMLGRGPAGELLALLVESDARAARELRDRAAAALKARASSLPEAPEFGFRAVSYPEDGAAADMLLDALFEATETWEEARDEPLPALKVPPEFGLVSSRSPTMRTALEVVARVSPTNATVLLSGETGSGKEVIADLIHANSERAAAPYVKVNCAAIPEALVESELFGYERGAFTGADRRYAGRFEQAHRGTLFLDEVGELPLPTQAKLLRVLQERRITRVGSAEAVDVDVRILAASNRDLGEAVRRGVFREDLFHRLHVIELRVPPLRERREDIPHLIDHFRRLFNTTHGLRIEAFAPDALDALYSYPWPGNVRELKNVVERTMLMAGSPTVERTNLALPAGAVRAPPVPPSIDGLTPRQERILKLARESGGVTNGEIVRVEAVSARTALREAQRLVDRGLLVRVGRRRGAIYRPATK